VKLLFINVNKGLSTSSLALINNKNSTALNTKSLQNQTSSPVLVDRMETTKGLRAQEKQFTLNRKKENS
jgi:hypothetical protein